MGTMTPAEVLAEYLGLSWQTHPHLYQPMKRYECRWHPENRVFVGENDLLLPKDHECKECGHEVILRGVTPVLALPNPLAPGHEADAWLGVLVRWKGFATLTQGFTAEVGIGDTELVSFGDDYQDPTPAIVRAMMAADSTFAAKMKGAEG